MTQAQHKSHSLQTAVDALHRREAQLALRDYENAHALPDESGYYNESKHFFRYLKYLFFLTTFLHHIIRSW